MATRNFIPEVIEKMAKGKVEVCPVCGCPKDLDAWICGECFTANGYGLVREAQDAARRAANKVSPEVWGNLLKVSREILSASDQPEGLEDRDLVEALKSNLTDVPEGAIFASLSTVRKDMMAEADTKAREAAREADRKARWRVALAAVEEKFPAGENIVPSFFIKNPIRFNGNGGFISEGMMKAACAQIRDERSQASKRAMAAAFVGKHIRKFDFGARQFESAAVPV